MTDSIKVNQSAAYAGLGTSTLTVQATGDYFISVQSTIPAGSALKQVINSNSVALATLGGDANDPTPTQPSIAVSTQSYFVAGDMITVVLSSSNSVDSVPNAVKSVINVYQTV